MTQEPAASSTAAGERESMSGETEQLAELNSSPVVLAAAVETSLKRVVQETAWTIKRRQQANAMGIDLASDDHELDQVKRACLGYLQGIGSLKNWLVSAEATNRCSRWS